mgnify:CR=1 FL=1
MRSVRRGSTVEEVIKQVLWYCNNLILRMQEACQGIMDMFGVSELFYFLKDILVMGIFYTRNEDIICLLFLK